jgi:hypothetical protein
MSLSDLTLAEVETLLEEHPWDVPEREDVKYVKGQGYVHTGVMIPAYTETIADGDVDWHTWGELSTSAYADDLEGKWKKGEPEYEFVDGLGKVFLEKQHGGEGMGDDYYIILRVTDDTTTRYFQKNGYHASHDGSYLDGSLEEVKPVQRTVTFFE